MVEIWHRSSRVQVKGGPRASAALDLGCEAITPEDTWVDQSLSGPVPPTNAGIRLRLRFDRQSGSNSNAAFDDIALTLSDRLPSERRLLVSVAQISSEVGAGPARVGGLAA